MANIFQKWYFYPCLSNDCRVTRQEARSRKSSGKLLHHLKNQVVMKKIVFFLVVSILISQALFAGDRVVVSRWLTTGPLDVNLPVFHNTPDTRGSTFSDRQLLVFDHIEMQEYFPADGKPLQWLNGQSATWQQIHSDADGLVEIGQADATNNPQVAYLAAYIHTERWIDARLEMKSPFLFEAWLNGEKIGTKSSIERQKAETGNDDEQGENNSMGRVGHQMKLPMGTHLLVIKALRPAGEETPWHLTGHISVGEPFSANDLMPVTDPANIKNIHHFMDGVKLSSLRPSPDGSMVAIAYRQSLPPSDRSESWTEIRRLADNSLVHSFRHANVSRISWLPSSNAISYTTLRDGRTTVHWQHMETGEKKQLLDGVEHFGGLSWSPAEDFFIYSVTDRGSGADATMRHILGMQDRQPHFRHRNFLYKYEKDSGASTRLTHGSLTTSLHDISPGGSHLVFSQSHPDYLERPYSKHHLFIMDLESLQTDTLLANQRWGVSTQFSPDGNYLLATGGPSALDRAGENIPQGMIANNYDTQAYIISLADLSVDAFTRDFDPSVVSVYWHRADNHIYLLAGDEDYRRLFRYNVNRRGFARIDTQTDFITSIGFASQSQTATYIGNLVNAPHRGYSINLRNEGVALLADPDAERYRHVQFGEVRDWDFTAGTGVRVKGRVYLPPDFDPEKTYPVIVYQYGGTNPVGRTFGGRYPFNLWAGNGYLVYVLQPSGATGFGQEFSAAHVNNWGKTVADEIIEGTRKFLEAHPFADPARVGVAGASYGGFMTMLLLTHTDIYAAGISHAGISNIASYWGEGYWGYSYSAEATANSFPWDSRDIYVGQSPLYRADRVNTPLLLITGDADTNVPPGESIQMYTALKLLGRPVELILVEGEDHHIVTYSKRLKWHDAIMAWWDRHLKEEPEWWQEQYPENNY